MHRSGHTAALLFLLAGFGGASAGGNDGIEIYVSDSWPVWVTWSPVVTARRETRSASTSVDDGDPPAGTTVPLNGVPLPLRSPDDPRHFDIDGAGVTPVAPRGLLTFEARIGARATRLSFRCPEAVAVTADPDPIPRDAPVTIGWRGAAFPGPFPFAVEPPPRLRICRPDSTPPGGYVNCGSVSLGAGAIPSRPATGAKVLAPAHLAGDHGNLAEFRFPGPVATQQSPEVQYHRGVCVLIQHTPFAAQGALGPAGQDEGRGGVEGRRRTQCGGHA